MHCAFLLRTIFASLARANERVRVQNVRDFPQTKLDSEKNAIFLLSTVTPTFYFINSMRTISSITEEKNWQKSMATLLANEVNATEGDIMGPTEQSPNYVFFKG